MPQFVLFFLSMRKDPGGLFFEFQRLIIICSRQDVHFDKGLPLLSYVFALFYIYPFFPHFLLLFWFCPFFAMLLAILFSLA